MKIEKLSGTHDLAGKEVAWEFLCLEEENIVLRTEYEGTEYLLYVREPLDFNFPFRLFSKEGEILDFYEERPSGWILPKPDNL